MRLSREAKKALLRFGLSESQLPAFGAGKSVAFYLRDAAEGTIAVAQMRESGRLRAGIYHINHLGGGLVDFLRFEARARVSARALGAGELEVLALELTNESLKTVLENGGFLPTTMDAPDELGNDTFDAISRIESVD